MMNTGKRKREENVSRERDLQKKVRESVRTSSCRLFHFSLFHVFVIVVLLYVRMVLFLSLLFNAVNVE